VTTGRHLKKYGKCLALIGMTERNKECKEKEVDKIAEQSLQIPQEEICLPSTLMSIFDFVMSTWHYRRNTSLLKLHLLATAQSSNLYCLIKQLCFSSEK
jgi:hypothetical protein